MPTYRLDPIRPADADRLRASGGVVHVADSKPGYPCRQCLQDAEIGEELLLVSHDPFEADSPYRSASPIFLHRLPCAPPADLSDLAELPDQLTCRQLSVRAFDAAEMMTDAAVIDGTSLDETISRLLADRAVVKLHVHNASRGCWAVTVRRGA
jgi:hypothetical protein